jgi:4-amino-4-deoxy-L-arabinose transferase-like glycosyltransferase
VVRVNIGRENLMLVLIALLLLVPGTAQLAMERQQELRVAICARNMVETGDWIVPNFQEQPRLRKPPLLYWMSASAMKLSGSKSVLTARIPALLAAMGLILVVAAAGRTWIGTRGGLLAGLLLASCIGFLRHGRLAETDITLTLFTTATVYLVYLALERRRLRYWIGGGLCMGLGILAKGPAAVAMPLLALGAYLSFVPSTRKGFRPTGLILLLALAALLAIPWYVAIHRFAQDAAGSQVSRELSALVKTEHKGNPAYYLYILPIMLLPWGVFLPIAIYRMWQVRKEDPRWLFLLGWLGSSFLLLTLTPSKQSHYAVLLLPPAALITAWYAQRFSLRTVKVVTAAVFGLSLVYFWLVYPRVNGLSRVPAFLTAARTTTDEAELIHVVGINSAVFDFYLGRHVHNTDDARQAWKRAGKGDAIVVIQKTSRLVETGVTPLRQELSGKYTLQLFTKE